MTSISIITVVGARPQFVKAAAVSRAIAASNNNGGDDTHIDEHIVHTGQHYDANMSKVFFDELGIPAPAVDLQVGSGPHGWQTGVMLERLEEVVLEGRPDWILVYGDTNSTLAGALVGAKLLIPVAHVEAGLRSFNRSMPEEINRILADRVASLLLCPTDTSVRNLANEGITEGVRKVGDVMYDSVLFNTALAEQRSRIISTLRLEPKSFYLATVHRAENTDNPDRLEAILAALRQMDRPVVLPLHPRTRKTLGKALEKSIGPVRVIDPVPYLDMLMLERDARMILTDSGGVQKEAYWFGVPCVTLRGETEWVELVEAGCNRLAGADTERVLSAVAAFEAGGAAIPHVEAEDIYGDGHSAEKVLKALIECTPR